MQLPIQILRKIHSFAVWVMFAVAGISLKGALRLNVTESGLLVR